ncbi:MAG: Mrp/NBP35 family ATP-binding protein [Rhodobacteraceae bacterium]|nr:Mrp/NBP35 family ATP-binding protein [Paracoccaceae bacterium]
MAVTREAVLKALGRIALPDGGDPVSRDLVRALAIEGGAVRFVLEAPSPEAARRMEGLRRVAEETVRALPGVASAAVALAAHASSPGPAGPGAAGGAAPDLRIGRHPAPQAGPAPIPGVARILAVASGKGGVGKSTVASNLAVALARAGRRVGLLDADIHGPSLPRMMGVSARPASPDGKTIVPLRAHGVTLMSIGLMLENQDTAVIWRGPMLMGALQQMLGQVAWGTLDVLVVDLPPGTGDVQLSLCQKVPLAGALIVSTPQDVALMDARKAIAMFRQLKAPVAGLVENMSVFVCPNCGHESHIFGHGGVEAEARRLDLPFLGALPLALEVRLAGDAGTPVAAGEGPSAAAYARLARRLVADGVA